MNLTKPFFHSGKSVANSPELKRVLALPRRSLDIPESTVQEMTALCKTDSGTQTLRPVQALALLEISEHGGLLSAMPVGSGKTIVSLLAPFVMQEKRPVLILPASLIVKTENEMRELCKHWKIPRNLRIISYQKLGRVSASDLLKTHRPSMMILDEAHLIKSKKSAVTRRIARYLTEFPDTRVIAMSGTLMSSGVRDFAHISEFALGDRSPLPRTYGDLEEWGDCLDAKVLPFNRLAPGALSSLANGSEDLEEVRKGFYARVSETPGVVCLPGTGVDCSLYLTGHLVGSNAITEGHFKVLREAWETPDGYALSDAMSIWRHARELALGFCYRWDPRPPQDWLDARRTWATFCRETLSHSHSMDSEEQVKIAVREGILSDAGALEAWEAKRGEFTINPVGDWHSDIAIQFCQEWIKNNHGIVWVKHRFFGKELAKRTGLSYYSADGEDQHGNHASKADPKKSFIASIDSCAFGLNLQAWKKNLITDLPTKARVLEQLIGRTHREGQLADEVEVDVMFGCLEHFQAWEQAHGEAKMASDMLGAIQKLLLADCTLPAMPKAGSRWEKPQAA